MEKFYSKEKKLGFSDVAIIPNSEMNEKAPQSRKDVNFYGVPVIVSNMYGVGGIKMAKAVCPQGLSVTLHKYHEYKELDSFLSENPLIHDKIFLSCGLEDEAFYHIIHLSNKYPNFGIRIDVPNGHIKSYVDFVKYVVDLLPKHFIIAGNIGSPEGFENLAKTGVDGVIAGIANGGFCKTANKAGVRYPQLSLCLDCKPIAIKYGCHLISDGGIKEPCDINKALVGGADAVICGSLFAGYEECDGEWEYEWKTRYGIWQPVNPSCSGDYIPEVRKIGMKFFGMSSKEAQDKFNGGLKEYRASEGRSDWVAYKGPVSNLIQDIKGSIASCATYIGANSPEEFYEKGRFVIV